MSWRVAILPCTIEGQEVTPEDKQGADWVIPLDAGDAYVDAIAALCNWRLPLRIFAPSQDDARLCRLLQTLEDTYCHPEADCRIFINPIAAKEG